MPEGYITSGRDPHWGFAGHFCTYKTVCVNTSSNSASVREHHAVCGLTARCIHSVVGDMASCRRCHWACSTIHGDHTDADHGHPLMREPSQKRRVWLCGAGCSSAGKTLPSRCVSSCVAGRPRLETQGQGLMQEQSLVSDACPPMVTAIENRGTGWQTTQRVRCASPRQCFTLRRSVFSKEKTIHQKHIGRPARRVSGHRQSVSTRR